MNNTGNSHHIVTYTVSRNQSFMNIRQTSQLFISLWCRVCAWQDLKEVGPEIFLSVFQYICVLLYIQIHKCLSLMEHLSQMCVTRTRRREVAGFFCPYPLKGLDKSLRRRLYCLFSWLSGPVSTWSSPVYLTHAPSFMRLVVNPTKSTLLLHYSTTCTTSEVFSTPPYWRPLSSL